MKYSFLSFSQSQMGSRSGFRVPGFEVKVFDASHSKPETRNSKLFAPYHFSTLTNRLMILVLAVFLLQGCGVSEPIRYYQLSSLPGADKHEAAESDKHGMIIGIGPVDIPRYVDRLQIVTRSAPNVVDLAEFDRWAEPVQADCKESALWRTSLIYWRGNRQRL